MRVTLRGPEHLRSLIRALRENSVVEDDDGYYHLEVTPENFKDLLKDEKLQELASYMTGHHREYYKQGVAICGWYGAIITPAWLK